MYTSIAQMRHINTEASSLLLVTESTVKGSYQYNKFLLDWYQYFDNLSQSPFIVFRLHYSGLLNQFSDTRRSRSQLSEYPMPKLPHNSILILLIVTETNLWRRHLYSQTRSPFRIKPCQDYLNRESSRLHQNT